MISQEYPSYIRTFGRLEAERRRRDIHGEVLFDPLELEYQYSLENLVGILDRAIESPSAVGPKHSRRYEPPLSSTSAEPVFSVRRDLDSIGTFYNIKEATEEPLTVAGETLPDPILAYILVRKGEDLIFESVRPQENPVIDAFTVLDLASAVEAYLID